MESLADHELKNWSRWCNSGALPHPLPPSRCASLESRYLPEALHAAAEDAPPPIHVDNAKRVQTVFDSAVTIERKILQAEYLSPWQYSRYSGGIPAAVRKINNIDPDVGLSVAAYETILASVKRRVERIFS
jgi:hypothetical protein